ncbi:MAG: sucrase ferredoxin [Actinomycetota bacterium]|nr:sucrase ferredoxin [Actinomycetota bacterium]
MTALCSATSLERAEPMTATASRVARWLLVEHPGAWGPESVPSRRMAAGAARALARTANEARARLLLIRRSAGLPRTDGREVYAVDSRPGGEQLWRRHVADDAELADLRPPYGGQDPTGWEPLGSPLYLVCTHGRHDRCCALLGRPVAKTLSQRFPEQTWECTHIGGDRFAANVLVLPEGLYLGRIEAAESVRVMDELAAGLLPAGRVRGRSSRPLPTQAAQQFAREATGRWWVTDLEPVRQEGTGPDTWSVRLAGPGGPAIEVVVRYDRRGGGEHHLTCDALEAKPIPMFCQVSLRELPADPGPRP